MKFSIQNRSVSRRIAVIGMTAAVYFVLTTALGFMSYREVQFRVSEIMNLLVFINPIFAPGIVLGCFLSNLFSPFGLPDIIFGTLESAIVVFLITRTKKILPASIIPVLGCFIIAAEIFFLSFTPPYPFVQFWLISLSVLGGEATVMLLVGYPLFKFVILKNDKLVKFLKAL